MERDPAGTQQLFTLLQADSTVKPSPAPGSSNCAIIVHMQVGRRAREGAAREAKQNSRTEVCKGHYHVKSIRDGASL